MVSFIAQYLEYVIQIENKPLPNISELENKSVAEVSFYLAKDSDTSSEGFGNSSVDVVPFRVYGIVANALSNKFSEYEAFYFSAESKHSDSDDQRSQKSTIYRHMTDQIIRRTNVTRYEKEDSYGSSFILSKIEIDNEIYENIFLKNLKFIRQFAPIEAK